MRYKFISVDINIIPAVKSFFENLKKKQSVKKNELLLKIYEQYPDNNGSIGIEIYEDDKKELLNQLKRFEQSELQACFKNDVEKLKKLIGSDEWAVFLKYAGKLDFDLKGCSSFTEKLAFENAKENAVNTVLSLPQAIIDFYKKELNNDN